MRTVTAVIVTELPPDDTSQENWHVEWVIDGKVRCHTHYSKKAAQRHVGNLLKDTGPGLTRDQVLTVNYRAETTKGPPSEEGG